LHAASTRSHSTRSGATGHCGGTPHSCRSKPAQFNILPDASGDPAETMRPAFLQHQGAPNEVGMLRQNTGFGTLIHIFRVFVAAYGLFSTA
jgi:hypothetical protein